MGIWSSPCLRMDRTLADVMLPAASARAQAASTRGFPYCFVKCQDALGKIDSRARGVADFQVGA